jgi:hypothetical protein
MMTDIDLDIVVGGAIPSGDAAQLKPGTACFQSREAVSFPVRMKEAMEDPTRLLIDL